LLGINAKEVSLIVVLDHIGSDGWELQSVVGLTEAPGLHEKTWYFKRERR
jgi:hypothetical protein